MLISWSPKARNGLPANCKKPIRARNIRPILHSISRSNDLVSRLMLGVAPEISSQQVLQAFHYDEPYLFLGAAFSTVGLLAFAFPIIRRKFDPLLFYFGIFAVLYGQRLWIQSEILSLTIHNSDLFLRLRSAADFIVPVPAVLFLQKAGFVNRLIDRIACYILVAESLIFTTLTFVRGPSDTDHLINSVFVIAAMLIFATQFVRRASDRDFKIVRAGLFIFVALVLWDN